MTILMTGGDKIPFAEWDDIPESLCPKCLMWQADLDGFGVLKCIHCDYCSHPSATKLSGLWRCDVCERLVEIDIG